MTRQRDDDVDATSRVTSSDASTRARSVSRPGLLLVFAGDRPAVRTIRLAREPTLLGRSHPAWRALADSKLSREHVEVALVEAGIRMRDLGSRNGSFVDGNQVTGTVVVPWGGMVRLGHSILCVVPDVLAFEDLSTLEEAGLILGPAMRATLDRARLHGVRGNTLLVRGETGTGKEVAARRFASTRDPFVAVNCAAIPANLAERLLFGAVRGAYSGAETQDGYLSTAHGGTLFLDELGELPLEIQAKLLRTLETGEVTPLGETRPRSVDVKFCFATHRDLREAVLAHTFREDLYYRIAVPEIVLPPLRERREEIAWLVASTCEAEQATATAKLVELCMRRPWPGNVRELRASVRDACFAARSRSATKVEETDLAAAAGRALAGTADTNDERARVERALAEAGGNLAQAARVLGIHRTQLYRLLNRLGIAH
jgi:transcriptional regulator of acetoin/glycerol metabolism